MLEFRSDTTTIPTEGMLRAMMNAPVGDDGFGEDASTNELESWGAQLFGKESGIFTASGTMSNQLALRLHTRPGDEVVVDVTSHFNTYESAPSADLAGVSLNTVETADGVLTPEHVRKAIDAKCRDPRYSQPRMIAMENTINYRAGHVVPLGAMRSIRRFAQDAHIRIHLDGARIFNAVVASGTPVHRYAATADTVSVCFAKGLGAPFGSLLVGPADLIDEARYYRKSYGGALHQCGYLAAAALYALKYNVERLAEDHRTAQVLASAIGQADVPGVRMSAVDTNIVIVDVGGTHATAEEVAAQARTRGLLIMSIAEHKVRFVTHMGVGIPEAMRAATIFREVTQDHTSGRRAQVPA